MTGTGAPARRSGAVDMADPRLLPSYCREAAVTYKTRVRVLVRCIVQVANPLEKIFPFFFSLV